MGLSHDCPGIFVRFPGSYVYVFPFLPKKNATHKQIWPLPILGTIRESCLCSLVCLSWYAKELAAIGGHLHGVALQGVVGVVALPHPVDCVNNPRCTIPYASSVAPCGWEFQSRLRIAASIAFLFRACFQGVLDTLAPLSRAWEPPKRFRKRRLRTPTCA